MRPTSDTGKMKIAESVLGELAKISISCKMKMNFMCTLFETCDETVSILKKYMWVLSFLTV